MTDSERIDEAVRLFPPTFGLKAFRGDRFTINKSASYVSCGQVTLYVFTEDGKAFCKGTPSEIAREVVPASAVQGVRTRGTG